MANSNNKEWDYFFIVLNVVGHGSAKCTTHLIQAPDADKAKHYAIFCESANPRHLQWGKNPLVETYGKPTHDIKAYDPESGYTYSRRELSEVKHPSAAANVLRLYIKPRKYDSNDLDFAGNYREVVLGIPAVIDMSLGAEVRALEELLESLRAKHKEATEAKELLVKDQLANAIERLEAAQQEINFLL